MGALLSVGLLLMVVALVVALISQRRAIRRDAAAIEQAEAELVALKTARLERERSVREQEVDSAVERALAKRASTIAKASGQRPQPVLEAGQSRNVISESSSYESAASARHSSSAVAPILNRMSVTELNDLVRVLQEQFGAPVAAVAVAGGGKAATGVEDKAAFEVQLLDAGSDKVRVIKAVREITGLGLKEAKDLVDSAPKVIDEGVPKADAEAAKKMLEDAGAKVELK